MVRPYTVADAPSLAAIHNQTYPQEHCSAASFREFIAGALAAGGRVWVAAGSQLNGYAIVSPVPGLPGIGDLIGCITPEKRRRGLGSELLLNLLEDLQESDFWQIAHHLTDLKSPGAHFLRRHQFFVEHEEWQMALADLDQLPETPTDPSICLQTNSWAIAVTLFCHLYQESFSELPWDQPFTPKEVAAALKRTEDILFLTLDGETIGFAWVDVDSEGQGLIEPLGIIPAYQGQGYGRILLQLILIELKKRGAQRVEIGAWCDNQAAVRLYKSFGFRHKTTFTYLAFNLKAGPT